jgi:membrane associated rhomboid family serine protease
VTEPGPPGPSVPGAPGGEPITCYRHPDREAHIRCGRCNRRICPDCMISASVGFQCPECVREGNKGVREARTAFGGRISGSTGVVTMAVLGICVVMFLLQNLGQQGDDVTRRLLLFPPDVASGEWYRLLSAAFLHDGLFHIGFNMFALWLFGPRLEQAFGAVRYLALYVLAAIGGTTATYVFGPFDIASLGASGAVFGLFAATIVMSRRARVDTSSLWVLLAINLAFGFVNPGIDWRAHIGGLVTGAVLAAAFVYAPKERRTLVHVASSVAVLVVLLAAVVLRTADLTGVSAARAATCAVTAPVSQGTYVECLAGI